ncbi:MAG: BBP7 family outer membrane beta-barrel protein [Gemmataceae bacterium]
MRKRLLGLASFLAGTAAIAAGPEILPVVDLSAQKMPDMPRQEESDTPRQLPSVPEELLAKPPTGAGCPVCLPEPPCKFLPEPCACNACCKPVQRYWANVEYLLWFVKDEPLNAVLFTQGPPASGGRLGAPGVRPLVGGGDIDLGSFNGGRITAGYWCNTTGTIGVEASGFVLERGGDSFSLAGGPNDPLAIARPFFNPLTSAEAARFVTSPPGALGNVFTAASSHLWGANADLLLNVRDRSTYRVDAIVGFDYLDLRETLVVGDRTFSPAAVGTNVTTLDSFASHNQFYGADLGLRGNVKRGRVEFIPTFKVALGVTHEVSENVGRTDFVTTGGTFTSPAGFLVVGSNSGQQVRDRFAAVPELNLKLAYRLCEHVNVFAAYDILYWSDVVRPGDQVDRVINPLQVPALTGGNPTPVAALPGPVRPSNDAIRGDFFAQGVSLGFGVTY